MSDAGPALLGIGMGQGEKRAIDAAEQAVSSPLLETTLEGAKSILLSITGGTTSRSGRSTRPPRPSRRPRTRTRTSSSARWSTRSSASKVWVTVVATGYGDRPAPRRDERAPGFREPAGEPRVSRMGRQQERRSERIDVDVPEYIPRF